MTSQRDIAASNRSAGFLLLLVTSFGWGLNWPAMKFLLTEWPPLSSRGLSALVGAFTLAGLAWARGQDMKVPRHLWPRLVLTSTLTISAWVAFVGLALVWLPASEAAVIASSMPVWVALLAFVILGERFSLRRGAALVIAMAGLALLFGAHGFSANADKLPGILFAFAATMCVAAGTVLTKRFPVKLPAISLAAWQIGIGCVPVVAAGLILERPDVAALSSLGWTALAYMTLIQFCVCYACWFAALSRLPASTASIGTLLVPVIGVISSGIVLGEPRGLREFAALSLTLGGVVLAARS
jgi:probable blue pigment (indigoidine) exporter